MIAWIGLGGNVGEVRETLRQALLKLEHGPCRVQAVSGLYASAPLGPTDQPDYLNAAARVATALGPQELLALLKTLELELGRIPRGRWRERELDLDLLLAAEQGPVVVVGAMLTLPHPGIQERGFVLEPLLELDSWLADPRDSHRFEEDRRRIRALNEDAVRLMEGQGWCRIS